MCVIGLGKLCSNCHVGIERCSRILEYHGDLISTDALHLLLRELQYILTFEPDLAACYVTRRFHDPQYRSRRHALAGTTLSYYSKHLALPQ